MRVLVPLLLVTAALPLVASTAGACHPDPALAELGSLKQYYVVRDVNYGGCPHELTFCVQVWEESNGQPGLQRTGTNPDHAVFVLCPFP